VNNSNSHYTTSLAAAAFHCAIQTMPIWTGSGSGLWPWNCRQLASLSVSQLVSLSFRQFPILPSRSSSGTWAFRLQLGPVRPPFGDYAWLFIVSARIIWMLEASR